MDLPTCKLFPWRVKLTLNEEIACTRTTDTERRENEIAAKESDHCKGLRRPPEQQKRRNKRSTPKGRLPTISSDEIQALVSDLRGRQTDEDLICAVRDVVSQLVEFRKEFSAALGDIRSL
eukprot:IDg3611t1